MARKSQRLSNGVSSPKPGHKRAASSTNITKEKAKRSKADDNPISESESASAEADDVSDFSEDSQAAASSNTTEDDVESGSESEFESKRKTTSRSAKSRKGGQSVTSTKTSAKSTATDGKTGYGPGTQVVTKRPVAKPAGKVPYRDEYLHPNTFVFLKELKENNQRSWLKFHDAPFRQAENDWFSFIDKITEAVVKIDDTVPELPVKDITFRIYRDVRFTKDPTPYKPQFSAAWSRTGRKGEYAGYFLQVAPGNSVMVGGLWHPENAKVNTIRSAIDHDSQRLKDVLLTKELRNAFLKGYSDEKKAVKAFIDGSNQDALKTKPKGYDGSHPDIDLLRLKSYVLCKKFTDDEMIGPGGLNVVAEYITAMKPMVTYLNSVIMPDEAAEDSSDGDDGEEEGSEEGDGSDSEDDE